MTVVLSYGDRSLCPTSTRLPERKKAWLLLMGDSVPEGTEGPLCKLCPFGGDVCCRPEAQVKDVKIMKINLPNPGAALRLLSITGGQQ